ncbi:zeta toxin family protein [Nocardioides sp. CER19]|uniref:zeta toxin family protein n=1 Tax=Nocardioides sp. CER19 TaxID=3038538 RepID=UPI0024493F54|nr:zeta toxin family protein [Nocardioides sp. CER19]MDH2413948.1 zeta toxin family protein [Nocardioides sp. CER19]
MPGGRDEVHAQLTDLLAPGGRLHHSTGITFDQDVLDNVTERYLAQQGDVARGGAMAVVTAGPPGAGKSFRTEHLVGYRRIDADEIKDLLLEHALALGLLDDATGILLSDMGPVSPRELSGRVHKGSTDVAEAVRFHAMARKENVLIAGTLQWDGLPRQYAGDLFDFDYERLRIVDVEVPLSVAIERARQRWWHDRHTEPLGGRFMSDEAVKSYFDDPSPVSRCQAHADELWDRTWEALDVVQERVEMTDVGATETTYTRRSEDGEIVEDEFPV